MKLTSKVLLPSILLPTLWFGVHHYMLSQIENAPSLQPLQPAATAVLHQDTSELRRLAKQGFNLNQSGTNCETLLSLATAHKLYQSFTTLLELGADPNLSSEQCGARTLYVASVLDDISYLKILLDHGGSPNARSSDENPLTLNAAKAFRWDNFWLLIDRGADINALDSRIFTRSGSTLIGGLAAFNQFEPIYKLMQLGADARLLGASGFTVAHRIRYNGIDPKSTNYAWMQKVKQLMISQGIDLNVPKYGPPPTDQWSPKQPGKQELLKEYEDAKAANAKYQQEHPEK